MQVPVYFRYPFISNFLKFREYVPSLLKSDRTPSPCSTSLLVQLPTIFKRKQNPQHKDGPAWIVLSVRAKRERKKKKKRRSPNRSTHISQQSQVDLCSSASLFPDFRSLSHIPRALRNSEISVKGVHFFLVLSKRTDCSVCERSTKKKKQKP